ncbi:MAG: EAL domain-containing protein [Beijerinckiaceae bacterium]
MAQNILRRRAAKAGALLLAAGFGAVLTTGVAQFAAGKLVEQDTGSVGKTIARNLISLDGDIAKIIAGSAPGKEFAQTLNRAIAGQAIAEYRLLDARGAVRFEPAGQKQPPKHFAKALHNSIASRRLETASGWDTGSRATFASHAFIPLLRDGRTVAVHAITVDQTERWHELFRKLLGLMLIACALAVASIGTPVLLWYRKNRELLIQEGENRLLLKQFKAVFDNLPQGVTLFDRNHKLVLANDQYAKFYKLKPEFLTPGTSVDELRKQRLAGGAPENLLDIYEKPQTSAPAAEQRPKRWRMDDGRTLETQRYLIPGGGWVTVHTNMTERLVREAEIDGARRFLDSVIEHMPGAVIVKRPDNLEYVLINKQVERLLGLPRDAIVGHKASEFFEAAQGAEIDRRDREVLADADSSVHISEQIVQTPGNGHRRISTKRIVVRDGSEMPAYLITMTEDVTEKRKAEEKVRFLALHDALTGLYNRAHFHDQLEYCLGLQDESSEMALILVDLDGFKEINDTFGHAAGDEVLRVTARRFRDIFCDIDMIARLGGDEFAILCRSASCHLELQSIAKRLIADIQKPIHFDGRQITVGATAGVALAMPGSIDAATILRYVDIAMYEAKEAGKGNYCFFDLAMMVKRLERKQLETDMVHAIDRNEFELHYQPIVDPRRNTVRSLEALLRWKHPQRGMVSPAEFIPVAEETGLIVPIGEHVLEMACRTAKQWPTDIRISVNLSPVQFRDRKLARKVIAILEKTGFDPKRLELEITEAALLQENEENMKILEELRSTGVRIVMDDFGAGYSSLNYLRSFPFDKIKIDRSYIKDLVGENGNGNSLTIVHAVLALAAGLSLATTAEGVETQEQLDILRAAGCDEIQGFFFSRPIPAEGVLDMINRLFLPAQRAA